MLVEGLPGLAKTTAVKTLAASIHGSFRRIQFTLGWLNRTSLLYWQKGRHGGSGAYRGARWHTPREVRALLSGLPVKNMSLRSAVFLPSGTRWAHRVERTVPGSVPWGGLVLVSGEKT